MLIVRLLGGLGNQMFQYAFGQRLSLAQGQPVYYDCGLMHNHRNRHAVNRQYSLDVFDAKVNLAQWHHVAPWSADAFPRWIRGVLKASGITRRQPISMKSGFDYDPNLLSTTTPAYFCGLWQSSKWFETIEPALRQSFRFRHPLPLMSQRLADEIREPNSVCVHVRRTDFITHQQSGSSIAFVGVDYYRQAIQRVLEYSEGLRFYVFSDDLDWCEREFDFIPNRKFVDHSFAGFKDSGHLQLLSLGRQLVIPNSTFSWWAAWLCEHSEKRVFIPGQWFRDDTDCSGLYLNDWQTVANVFQN